MCFRYTSLLGVGVGIILFLLTSFSDPGTVTAENVSQYLSAYPYDNTIFFEKYCSTCKIPRFSRHFNHLSLGHSSSVIETWLVLIFFFFPFSDLQGPNIVEFAAAVWHALTIIVDGWYAYFYFPWFLEKFQFDKEVTLSATIYMYFRCFILVSNCCRIIALGKETTDTFWLFFYGE